MLALLLAMRGTILLYQGEELGLPEVDLRRDQLRDPVGDLYYPLFKGRDGCRTPMPWEADEPNLGFTSGKPWLPLGAAHASLSVSAQEESLDTNLNYARLLLAARSTSVLRLGSQILLDAPLPLIAFTRADENETILCVFNLGREPICFSHPLLARAAAPLDWWGCGEATFVSDGLLLGPCAAWFSIV
jgi:alpha-glucosidase